MGESKIKPQVVPILINPEELKHIEAEKPKGENLPAVRRGRGRPRKNKIPEPKRELRIASSGNLANKRVNHEATDYNRGLVTAGAMAGYGDKVLCRLLGGISVVTLHRHYRKELDHGRHQVNIKVIQSLYKAAVEGNVTAQIFWAKTRLGWKEKSEVEHTGNPFISAVQIVVKKGV